MAMLRLIRRASPPNIRFSSSPFSPPISSRMRSARSSSYAMSIQVDADREKVGAHHPDRRAVQPRQVTQPSDRVVVGKQVGGPGAPATTDTHAHFGIGLDVSYIV